MNRVPYTYCLVRYVHDPAAGEMLNIGVLLYAPHVPFVAVRLERRYERLSSIYADFDGDHYRRTIARIESAVERISAQLTRGLYQMWDAPEDVGGIGTRLFPDTDLSYRLGPMMAGVTLSPAQELDAIFYRMVSSQNERPISEHRSDDDVWALYRQPLVNRSLSIALQPKVVATNEIEIKFEHAFKNSKWQALQPMTMDYVRVETMRDKATRWLGNAVALKESSELGHLYILLGPPQLASHMVAYDKAKNILHKMPIPHDFIEEDGAEDFASWLERYMIDHGVLNRKEQEDTI